MQDKFNQAPEDVMTTYQEEKVKRNRRKDEALQLEKFLQRAGPVVEILLEENDNLLFN